VLVHWGCRWDSTGGNLLRKELPPAAYFLTGKISPRNEIKNQKFEYELIYEGFKFQSPELK
jgi:hypothetical protein